MNLQDLNPSLMHNTNFVAGYVSGTNIWVLQNDRPDSRQDSVVLK